MYAGLVLSHLSFLLLGLQLVLDVLKVNLFILDFFLSPQIFHVLLAEKPQVIYRFGHVHDRFAYLAKAKRYLHEIISAWNTCCQLALAQKLSLTWINGDFLSSIF